MNPQLLYRRPRCTLRGSLPTVISLFQNPLLTLLQTLLLTMALALFSQAQAQQSLPELGSASGGFMTPAQEKRLGQAFMRSIKSREKLLDEPFATEYIEDLGKTLALATDESQQQPFVFFILDNPGINAFAGPGGHIGIFSGLVLTTQSESELAAVVAHEIAHVTQKHLMRTFYEASQLSVPSAAILLASVILGATVGGDAAIAAAVTGQAAMIQQQINFTRANEKEADRVGMQTLSNAEFEPHAMPLFFERMGRANRTYSTKLPELLRTHPVTTSRIADSLARAEQKPYRQRQDDLRYHLLKALLRARSFSTPQQAATFFRTNLADGRYREAQSQRFGLVIALMQLEDFAGAEKELDALLRDNPTEPAFLIQQSRLLAKTDRLKKAVGLLEDALLLYPGRYSLVMQLAELHIQGGKYEQAIELLQAMTETRPLDDQLYKRMAEAAGKNNDKVIAHAYQADYLYLNGRLEAAIQQLEIALREKTTDFYLSSRLEARLQAMQQEFDLIKQDNKK